MVHPTFANQLLNTWKKPSETMKMALLPTFYPLIPVGNHIVITVLSRKFGRYGKKIPQSPEKPVNRLQFAHVFDILGTGWGSAVGLQDGVARMTL